MKDKTSVTSSLSNKDTLTDAQVNAGFDFNTILTSPDLNGQLYDIDSQVNIITKEICNFLTNNGVTLNSGDNSQVYTLLNSLFSAKQNTLVAGANITIDENNVISTTGSSPANIPLFWFGWLDSKPQNVSWVNASNYSWLYASTYVSAYEKLDSQLNPVGTFVEGDSYYVCMFSDGESFTTTVPVNSGTLAQLESWCSSQGYTYSGATIEELECYMTLSASSETIEGITITYYETFDGKKIVVGDAEIANAESIYNVTGSAWYYIMDTVNQRFKLPRINPAREDLITLIKIKGNGKSLGLIGKNNNTLIENSLAHIQNYWIAAGLEASANVGANATQGTIPPNTYIGVNTDPTKSGLVADPTESNSVFAGSKYLYFYLGMSGEEETAEIAGIKAETINNKADRNLLNVDNNVDFVIDSQLPTAENNYTWYRKYASGWVEQGGISRSLGFRDSTTITLPVAFADTHYFLTSSAESRQTYGNRCNSYSLDTKTTTTFQIYGCFEDPGSGVVTWEAKGFAAS